ncbi:MAG: hypothetical protein ACI3XA_05250 [Clostridia bacterium]
MKKFAYLYITDTVDPKGASDSLLQAKEEGFDNVILLHHKDADIRNVKYKEKILAFLRGAYRHKMSLYISDDCFTSSGTAFGGLCSVKDLWQKRILSATDSIDKSDIITERDGALVTYGLSDENYPYYHYPDLTNPLVADMIIQDVYKPLVKEFSKFTGYEFKGFISVKPMVDSLKGDVIYSEEALNLYKEKYGEISLSTLLKKGEEYSKYMSLAEKCVEQNFVWKLKNFCRDNNLEYIVCGGENSLSDASLKQSAYSFTDKKGNGYLMWADSLKKVINAGLYKMGVVMPISPAMKKMESIREFLELVPTNCPVKDLNEIDGFENRLLITNMTDNVRSVCLLFKDAYIYDLKAKEAYPIEKTTYTFHPYSYLYIVKKKSDMYTSDLPAIIGGVRIGETGDAKIQEFEKRDNICTFYLPEENLAGKCLEFEGDFDYLCVRVGSMEEVIVQKPFALPLYGFLRGARGAVEAFGGVVSTIKIR